MSFRRGVRLAIDWGDARIGVAACDPEGVLAYPAATVVAGPQELTTLVNLIAEYDPIEVIVGFPRSLDGHEGPAASIARDRAGALAARLHLPVRLVDERLTTVTAAGRLRAGGKTARQQRASIDAAAAVVILEQAVALERSRSEPPGELVSAPDGRQQGGPGTA